MLATTAAHHTLIGDTFHLNTGRQAPDGLLRIITPAKCACATGISTGMAEIALTFLEIHKGQTVIGGFNEVGRTGRNTFRTLVTADNEVFFFDGPGRPQGRSAARDITS
jgi:hypothetical protein